MRPLTLLAVSLTACGGTRTIRIESSPPAKILDGAAVACPTTPCEWSFSRETCWGFDSSLGYFRLVAVSQDGRELSSPMLRTCGVKRGTRLSFRFETDGECAVIIAVGSREQRFDCAQPPAAGPVRPRR